MRIDQTRADHSTIFDAKPNIPMGKLEYKQALLRLDSWLGKAINPPIRKMGNRHQSGAYNPQLRVTAIKNIRLLGSEALVLASLTLTQSRTAIQGKVR